MDCIERLARAGLIVSVILSNSPHSFGCESGWCKTLHSAEQSITFNEGRRLHLVQSGGRGVKDSREEGASLGGRRVEHKLFRAFDGRLGRAAKLLDGVD